MIDIEKISKLQEFSKELTVLYVEDNEEARLSTIDVLGEFFDNILVSVDGEEGVEKFKQRRPDLIITDINMPKLNGIDMVAKIREMDEDVPILIISAYSESGYFMETIRLGVEGYLLKPIELSQFLNVLAKTIDKIKLKQMQNQYQSYLEKENQTLNNDIQKKDKMIQDQIYKDSVTGLNNRFALEKDLETTDEYYTGLIMVDINNFRKFNEHYGFEIGNLILSKTAKDLQSYAKENGFNIYKVSADEFVLSKRFVNYDLEYLHNNTKNLLEVLDNKRLKLNEETEVILNITLGISLDKDDVLTKCSSALDMAKLNNKKCLFYDDGNDFEGELKSLFYWQKEIDNALEKDNIVPYFQPIYDENKNIVKYEVLMRMIQDLDSETKIVSPYFFLDVSIKTKQYDRLSLTIVKKALEHARKNRDKVFSINLGFRDIINIDIKEIIAQYVRESLTNGLKCNLVFEIVESEDITDYKDVKKFFDNFSCANIKVAIDDFGSGYSNFSNLLEINPQYLKIDGSLIKDIDTNITHLILVKAIISFAKKLEIKTIAEFVHSNRIFEILKDEGVDEFQGFYLGEPNKSI